MVKMDKLKELILLAVSKGTTSYQELNSALYWIDKFEYASTGEPFTGAVYRKCPSGVYSDDVAKAIAELLCEGRLGFKDTHNDT